MSRKDSRPKASIHASHVGQGHHRPGASGKEVSPRPRDTAAHLPPAPEGGNSRPGLCWQRCVSARRLLPRKTQAFWHFPFFMSQQEGANQGQLGWQAEVQDWQEGRASGVPEGLTPPAQGPQPAPLVPGPCLVKSAIFLAITRGGVGVLLWDVWVSASEEAVKDPTMPGAAPTTRNY